MTDPAHAADALRHLRAHRRATLLVDDTPHTLRTVIDGAAGRVVANVPPDVFEAQDLLLVVPEENPELGPELQAIVHASPVDPDREPACDRWLAAHATPQWPTWAALAIDSLKFEGEVIDGEALTLANPFWDIESTLLRVLNKDRAALAALVRRACGVDAERPIAVGIDPDGVDVRSPSGVLPFRVPIDARALRTEAAVEAHLKALLAGTRP